MEEVNLSICRESSLRNLPNATPEKTSATHHSKDEVNSKLLTILEFENKLESLISKYLSGTFEINELKFETLKAELRSEFSAARRAGQKENLTFFNNPNLKKSRSYKAMVQKYNDFLKKIENFIQQSKFDSRFLYNVDFKNNRTVLSSYDIETNRTSQEFLETPFQFYAGTTVIQLPNKELFFYGNSYPSSGACCIIDLKSISIKKILPPGPPSSYSEGLYYKNCIFLFGGLDEKDSLGLSIKLNLKENRWIQLTPLPLRSYRCSCVNFNGSILLCGNLHENLYKFDLEIESYSEIKELSLKMYKNKMLFNGKSRVYAIEELGNIFESGINNEYKWDIIGEFKIMWYSCAMRKFWKEEIFISFISYGNMNCYKFDLNRKILEKAL
ncbi:unnamed protein product [Blepharisma stoltei]|uniref:Kelch motif family protein n=1 Tax=Blepharisma stoltei TaxID=1481888 RepID=A0AAU9JBT9_9CILI|nr:unnamed protein product [Blepharisma stoltei]